MGGGEGDDGEGKGPFEAFAAPFGDEAEGAVTLPDDGGGGVGEGQDQDRREIRDAVAAGDGEDDGDRDGEEKFTQRFSPHAVKDGGDVVVEGDKEPAGGQEDHVDATEGSDGPEAIEEPRKGAEEQP